MFDLELFKGGGEFFLGLVVGYVETFVKFI